MNKTEENGSRHQQKGALKQKYAKLTEDDQLFQEGEEQETFGKIQVRLGKTQEDLFRIIDTL